MAIQWQQFWWKLFLFFFSWELFPREIFEFPWLYGHYNWLFTSQNAEPCRLSLKIRMNTLRCIHFQRRWTIRTEFPLKLKKETNGQKYAIRVNKALAPGNIGQWSWKVGGNDVHPMISLVYYCLETVSRSWNMEAEPSQSLTNSLSWRGRAEGVETKKC